VTRDCDLPGDPGRRRLFARSLPAGAALAAGLAWAGAGRAEPDATRVHARFSVTDFGAVGDGRTASAAAFQRAIDAAEAAGGGIVGIPPGTFILERTPLIASRVHLVGVGRASVLRGERPAGHRGAALISNKGQHARGYEGASDWSLSHLAIDSPKTNGIVITHAARVYLGRIHGVEVYHHFVDNVGCQVLCENLFLTGRSGTSTFQIDSLAGAQTIWDGRRAVEPNHDGTQARDLILRDSFITAAAGHAGDNPKHFCSLHFHGEQSAGFMFSNLVLGGAPVGIYQDAGSHYADIQIDNLRSTNRQAAARFNGGCRGQSGLVIRGLVHRAPEAGEGPWNGLVVEGHDEVIVADSQLLAPDAAGAGVALALRGCRNVRIDGLQARARGGTAIAVDDAPSASGASAGSSGVLIDDCQFTGFDSAIRAGSGVVGGLNTLDGERLEPTGASRAVKTDPAR